MWFLAWLKCKCTEPSTSQYLKEGLHQIYIGFHFASYPRHLFGSNQAGSTRFLFQMIHIHGYCSWGEEINFLTLWLMLWHLRDNPDNWWIKRRKTRGRVNQNSPWAECPLWVNSVIIVPACGTRVYIFWDVAENLKHSATPLCTSDPVNHEVVYAIQCRENCKDLCVGKTRRTATRGSAATEEPTCRPAGQASALHQQLRAKGHILKQSSVTSAPGRHACLERVMNGGTIVRSNTNTAN